MLENEAKTKLCPIATSFARVVTTCLGDQCVLWVWTKTYETRFGVPKGTTEDLPREQWHGKCGLIK